MLLVLYGPVIHIIDFFISVRKEELETSVNVTIGESLQSFFTIMVPGANSLI